MYPYAVVSYSSPSNPNGCWDWWGYTNSKYAYNSGVQMAFVKSLTEHLMKGTVVSPSAQPVQLPPSAPVSPPTAPTAPVSPPTAPVSPPSAPVVTTTVCPIYLASATTDARYNTTECAFDACYGDVLEISQDVCNGAARLFDQYDEQIAMLSGNQYECKVSLSVPVLSGEGCYSYKLHQGCADDNTCSGTFTILNTKAAEASRV